jgi:hypothetical protein
MSWTDENLNKILILLNKAELSLSKENEKAILESALSLTKYINDSYQRKNYYEHIIKKLNRLK